MLSQKDAAILKSSAKRLLDNHDFDVIMKYLDAEAVLILTTDKPEDADTNLRNLKALRAVVTSVESLTKFNIEDSF